MIEEAIQSVVADALAQVHVSMPGRVESYDYATGKARIQPLIKRRALDENEAEIQELLPIIVGVPIMFPGLGETRLVFPVNRGDLVMLLFSHASLSRWLARGGIQDDTGEIGSTLDDAIAFPGLYSFAVPPEAHTSAAVLQAERILLGSNTANDPVARRSDLDALVTAFNAHVHATAAIGSPSPPTVPTTTPICSAKVSVE